MTLKSTLKHPLRIQLATRWLDLPAEGAVDVSKEEATALREHPILRHRIEGRQLEIAA